MKLEFCENQAVVWVMESPQIFRKFGQELMAQTDGEEGGFILSEHDSILDIKQNIEMIMTPYAIDMNDKKCLNKIYAEMRDLAYNEQHYLKTQSVLGQIHNYLMELKQDASVDLAYAEPDMGQIFKAFGVRIENEQHDILSSVSQYLKVAVRLLNKRVLVFVNLSFYMEKSEIEELLQEAFYLKVAVVLIEQKELNFSVDTKCYIIDKDNCEIF